MAQLVLSMGWGEHSSSLAAECKNLLHSSFLADCSIVAEGRSLEAHRLILSAGSHYFHMLFSEVEDVHPMVILAEVPFDALKAVLVFVYSGEVQIPPGHWEAFLTLAQALQVRGLEELLKQEKCKLACDSATYAPECPSEDNLQLTNTIQSTSENLVDSSEMFSDRHLQYYINNSSDAVNSNSCALIEGRGLIGVDVKPSVPPQKTVPPLPSDLHTEIIVKDEPMRFDSVKYERREGDEMEEVVPGNDASEKDERLFLVIGDEKFEHNAILPFILFKLRPCTITYTMSLHLVLEPFTSEEEKKLP